MTSLPALPDVRRLLLEEEKVRELLCIEDLRFESQPAGRLMVYSRYFIDEVKMTLDVTFLGTGSAYPGPSRGASALVLRNEGECWLFDCGEGTQTQFMRSNLKAGRITKIFITHLHGDHMFGLPGLLCTVSLQSSTATEKQPVDIYGPVGLRSFIWRSLYISHSQLVFSYRVHELVPSADQCPSEEFKDLSLQNGQEDSSREVQGRTIHMDPIENCYTLIDDDQFIVRAFRLFHRIPSFGFAVEERARPGKLNVQKLKELEIAYGRINSRRDQQIRSTVIFILNQATVVEFLLREQKKVEKYVSDATKTSAPCLFRIHITYCSPPYKGLDVVISPPREQVAEKYPVATRFLRMQAPYA
ncbi:zinc phosphodiesterase ELAC protein 1 isoform X3 [Lissotriton helveticus]